MNVIKSYVCGQWKKVHSARTKLIAEPFEVIHSLSIFLPNTKGFGLTSGLQFLTVWWFGKHVAIIDAALTSIIARWTTSNLKIHPNVHNTYKPANIRVMAQFAAQLTRVSTPVDDNQCLIYVIHHRELIPCFFDLFWTTLHQYVPRRSVRWRCVTLHTQARNLCGNLCRCIRVRIIQNFCKFSQLT